MTVSDAQEIAKISVYIVLTGFITTLMYQTLNFVIGIIVTLVKKVE